MLESFTREVLFAESKSPRGWRGPLFSLLRRAQAGRHGFLGLEFVQLLHPAVEGLQPLFQLRLHLLHLFGLLFHDAVLPLDDVYRTLKLAALFVDRGVGAVLSPQLAEYLFGLDHLLDLGKRDTQQVLQASDMFHALHILLGIESEPAYHARWWTEKALLFIEAQGALSDAGALGDFAYLEICFIHVRHCNFPLA